MSDRRPDLAQLHVELQQGHATAVLSAVDQLESEGPLADEATVVMYEGAPMYPDGGRFWRICEELGVTIFYTAPTAIRALMKLGAIAKPDDIRFGDNLPKTRSGKIMRRLLRAIARGEEITQDVSTLENLAIVEQLRGEE